MKKKAVIPVGYEDLKEIIRRGMYYVDKTIMIKELLWTTRISRWIMGICLTASPSPPAAGVPGSPEQYAVFNLSLKSAKQPDFDLAYTMLK
ncbi:MAG: hypothetical protein SOR93_12715 [Clostridiales Family XIII bacterium]|nr:hypothetical protein [Anaerovorax odorimutans]MCI7304405.1 hypothetical protein [Clostridia bacterium]MDE8732993.1 hypothetical protein [Eubacteriales bacterium DFI.9.88]MDY3012097.1 hypothetical protein [Clostridiales Family XIII bacterium]